MLRERYEAQNLFAPVPALSLSMEPVLTQLDTLLDDDILFQTLKSDLQKRSPHTLINARPSTPVEGILRMLVLKHRYGWSYQQTEHWVNDSLVLRQFCRVYLHSVPDDTTLLRWANTIKPQTLHDLLDQVVLLARSLKITRARKLRTDGTVVETNIHHPSDSTLLADGVRVLSRLVKRARHVLTKSATFSQALFRDRQQSAKRLVRQITETTRQRGEQAEALAKSAYERLVGTTQALVAQAGKVQTLLSQQADQAAQRIGEQLQTFVPRIEQVIEQTRRRVLQGQSVPSEEKLVSLFEPHTAILRKGKRTTPTQFGRSVWLDEIEGGLIRRYEVRVGNPCDQKQIVPSVDHHRQVFEQPPRLLAGDRGTYSAANEAYAKE